MNQQRLDYIIKHEPMKYILKKGILFWYIETLNGEKAGIFWTKRMAKNYCDLYNGIYTWGYRQGCMSVYNEIVGNNDFSK